MFKKLQALFGKREPGRQLLYGFQRLDLRENDIVVVTTKQRLTADMAVRLRASIEDLLRSAGHENKVIVLEEGVKVGAIGGGDVEG